MHPMQVQRANRHDSLGCAWSKLLTPHSPSVLTLVHWGVCPNTTTGGGQGGNISIIITPGGEVDIGGDPPPPEGGGDGGGGVVVVIFTPDGEEDVGPIQVVN